MTMMAMTSFCFAMLGERECAESARRSGEESEEEALLRAESEVSSHSRRVVPGSTVYKLEVGAEVVIEADGAMRIGVRSNEPRGVFNPDCFSPRMIARVPVELTKQSQRSKGLSQGIKRAVFSSCKFTGPEHHSSISPNRQRHTCCRRVRLIKVYRFPLEQMDSEKGFSSL